MIYVVCGTQVFTALIFMVCLRWALAYLADRDKIEQRSYELDRESFERMRRNADEALMRLIEEHRKDRELLIERIQHPPATYGQAAGVGGKTSSVVIDEDYEAEEEFGDQVKPIQPTPSIKPVFAGEEA